MNHNRHIGESGEEDILNLIACPNCGKGLMRLPKNYPLFDFQCTACVFRAQLKTNSCKPKNEIFGAGWDVMEKVLKSGFMVPPLIVNLKWAEYGSNHQKILFFPFIPKSNLKHRRLKPSAKRGDYVMFNYIGLLDLPHFVLYDNENKP